MEHGGRAGFRHRKAECALSSLVQKLPVASSILFLGLAVFCTPASAQVSDRFANTLQNVQSGIDSLWPRDLRIKGVSTRIGIAIATVPDYRGSDDYSPRLLPLIDIRYEDRVRLFNNKLSVAAFKKGYWEVGPQLILNTGRKQSSNAVLEGTGDIKNVFMGGIYARYQSENALFGIDYRQALSDRQGWSLELTAGHGIYRNGQFSIGVGARAKYRSTRSTQTAFGLTEAQAEGSVFLLPAFTATSGLNEVNVNALLSYKVTEKIRFLSLITAGRLLGDARKSPLVREHGSANQLVAGVGLFFQF